MDTISFDWRTLTLNAPGFTMDNLSTIPTKISEILRHPSENMPAFLLMIAIAVVFIIVLALTVIAWLSRPKDPYILESYVMETTDIDEMGNPVAVLVEEEVDIPKDPSRKYYVALSLLVMVAIMWVVTGITTQVNPVCLSCHVNDPHVEEQAGDPHAKTRCVGCHEENGLVGSVTVGVPTRLAHIVVGTFKKTNVPGYASFPQESCANCHGEVVEKDATTTDQETGVRMSHYEPNRAGMACTDCHILDSDAKISGQTAGMQPCLSCHNGVKAPSECSSCHGAGQKIIASTSPSPDNAQPLIQPTAVSKQCYECHDPAPCDSCHGGYRMPHPDDFDHVAATARNGVSSCYKCHGKGAVPCSECHSGEGF